MRTRFTVIQGGLSVDLRRPGAERTWRAATWRIAVRRPIHVVAAERDAWRSLHGTSRRPDPFADPDFLLTAAQHAVPVDGGAVFALAYAVSAGGRERLAGVLPLQLPHPLWGGPAIMLWQPTLAPDLVDPLFEEGAAPAAIEAVLTHLRSLRPRTGVELSGLPADGTTLRALAQDGRFRIRAKAGASAIPQGQFVAIGATDAGKRTERTERVTAPGAMRDAVERFLLADARASSAPLLDDPAATAAFRVITRRLARRGCIEVALGFSGDDVISGTISLGAAGERVVWRRIGRGAPRPAQPRTADVTLDRAIAPATGAHLRLVGARG